MLVDSPDILAHLRLDRFEQEIIDGVEGIRENKFRPRKDTKFVARRIEVVTTCEFVGRLVDTTSPDAKL